VLGSGAHVARKVARMPDPEFKDPSEWTEADLLDVARDHHHRPKRLDADDPDSLPADRAEWTTEQHLQRLQEPRR
jgi:hypothetical protein